MHQLDEIIFNERRAYEGYIGEIILNRPRALNALTLSMCEKMYVQLQRWSTNHKIKAVWVKSSSERAFCAGGDIRHFYENRHLPIEQLAHFFKQEYLLDATVFHFSKPYISFLDGITMGGGAGISIHGSCRIATEKLIFAMPETGIGFFPDVGATYFLTRCPGRIGWYLGLTGVSITAAETYAIGLTNYFVSSDSLESLENKLSKIDLTLSDNLFNTIKEFSISPGKSELLANQKVIDECFSENTIEKIFKNLENHPDVFAKNTLEILKSRSPNSLKITLDHLNQSVDQSFDEVIKKDLVIATHFLKHPDFYEGVRAVLIDKDKNPRWQR